MTTFRAVLANVLVLGALLSVGQTQATATATSTTPRIVIPAVGVDAPLVTTATPSVPMTTASLSSAYKFRGDGELGRRGSVLISLHSNRGGWAEGNNLPSLRVGAEIRIVTADKTLRYRVVRVQPRAPLHTSERDMARLRSNLGESRIVVTTCNRNALDANGNYQYRTLAYAELVG